MVNIRTFLNGYSTRISASNPFVFAPYMALIIQTMNKNNTFVDFAFYIRFHDLM